MLKLYGVPFSRAARNMWLCREIGLEHEEIEISLAKGDHRSEEFLAVNPNGKIPAIDDDGFCLWESMAINFYLAKKYGGDLMPRDIQGEAQVLQWSFWVMTEIEKTMFTLFYQRITFPPGSRLEEFFRGRIVKDPEVEREAREALEKPFSTLNQHLADRDYLLGSDFTVADLNVASILRMGATVKLDLSDFPNMQQWLQRCLSRPAAQ